jgi:hypothetical protein
MKRTTKKLQLRKETLATLGGNDLTKIRGGLTSGCPTAPCTLDCDPNTSQTPSCNGLCTNEN